MAGPARRHVTIDGRRHSYLEAGEGRTLILLHAFPLSARMWEPQAARPPEGWRLLAPDLRGFGESGAADPGVAHVSLLDYAADVLALLAHLELKDAVIGGLSLGGYIAFELLRRAPHVLRGLVLANTRPQADTEEGRRNRERMQSLVEREGPGAIAGEMLPKLLAEETVRERPEVAARVRTLIEANTPAAIKAALEAMKTRPDSTPDLAAIRCPTLIIAGERDQLTPVAESELMHRHIPHSVLKVLPGAGHLSNLERPEAFSSALSAFLAAGTL